MQSISELGASNKLLLSVIFIIQFGLGLNHKTNLTLKKVPAYYEAIIMRLTSIQAIVVHTSR